MPNPFPGMNPYLEQPDFWSDFHNQLVAALARALVPRLLPKYRVVTDKWVYTVTDTMTLALGRPDVSIQQRKLDESSVATVVQRPVQPVPVRVPMPLEIQQAYLEVKDATTQEVVTVVEVVAIPDNPVPVRSALLRSPPPPCSVAVCRGPSGIMSLCAANSIITLVAICRDRPAGCRHTLCMMPQVHF